jgi:hypothetical protein
MVRERRSTRSLVWRGGAATALAILLLACQSRSADVQTAAAPTPVNIMLAVAAIPDSVLKLAKTAMTTIDGTLQLPTVRPTLTTVSTHYVRNRRGGGQTQVAVMAAIDRRVADPLTPITVVQLSAWALDMPHQLTPAQRRAGIPITPITTNTPATPRPRAITMADTSDWRALEFVVEAFVKHGARRLP